MKKLEQGTALNLLRKYDAVPSYNLAQRLLDGVTREEIRAWVSHPCTQSLIASLDGDVSDLVTEWLSGHYAQDESSDATAQLQAMARGKGEAYNMMLDRIADIQQLQEATDES